jgi:hypothetical protein
MPLEQGSRPCISLRDLSARLGEPRLARARVGVRVRVRVRGRVRVRVRVRGRVTVTVRVRVRRAWMRCSRLA